MPRARAVEVEVAEVVLGQDADPVALADPEAMQAGGEGVHAPLKLAERHHRVAFEEGGRVAVNGSAAGDEVVDGEGLRGHAFQLSQRLRRL